MGEGRNYEGLSSGLSSNVSTQIGYSEHVDAHPAWRVPAVEAGIDLAECRFRRHARRRLLCYRVRPRVLPVAAPPPYVPRRVRDIRRLRCSLPGDPASVEPHLV